MGTYEKKGYRSFILLETSMLTNWHIEMQLAWAEAYFHNN